MTGKAKNKLRMPLPEKNGFIKTLNNMGYMTSDIDTYSQKFIDDSQGKIVLEIGAAYGITTLACLNKGVTKIYANDIDANHLEILRSRAKQEDLTRLSTQQAAFPQDDLKIEPASLDAILACRVFHFFDGSTICKSLKMIYQLLKPGGKIYIVVESPYLKNFQEIIPEFEKRKQAGEQWPGYIDNVHKIAPDRGASLPPSIHFFDPETLARAITENSDFKIEQSGFINRMTFPEDLRLDGRESTGIIGVKRFSK